MIASVQKLLQENIYPHGLLIQYVEFFWCLTQAVVVEADSALQ